MKEWYLHLYGTTENPDRPQSMPPPVTTTAVPTTTNIVTTTSTYYTTTVPTTVGTTRKSQTSTSKPRSATYKPTAQYYPLTTAKSQMYPKVEDDPMLKANGLSQEPSTKMEIKESGTVISWSVKHIFDFDSYGFDLI